MSGDPDNIKLFCEVKCELSEHVTDTNSVEGELCDSMDQPRRNGLFSITKNLKIYRTQGK
ncbi:unnamed protein product, partial [Callosobruchus maculatus]